MNMGTNLKKTASKGDRLGWNKISEQPKESLYAIIGKGEKLNVKEIHNKYYSKSIVHIQ